MNSKEIFAKAKNVKSVEELLALAQANNVALTNEDATKYFAIMKKEGVVADEELSNVCGGCGEKEEPKEYYVCGTWAPSCNGSFSKIKDRIFNWVPTEDCCAVCVHFHALNAKTSSNPSTDMWEGKCTREFD